MFHNQNDSLDLLTRTMRSYYVLRTLQALSVQKSLTVNKRNVITVSELNEFLFKQSIMNHIK